MPSSSNASRCRDLGIVGFGAFGQLIAMHLCRHFRCIAFDPIVSPDRFRVLGVDYADTIADVARCSVVVLAVPVMCIEAVLLEIAPLLRAGTLVVDVGSVKMRPAEAMTRLLPPHVEMVATHPLFGPHSARDGIRGKKIVVCPLRGFPAGVVAFLRRIGLQVIVATPEDHDRDAAQVQGLTHAIARMLVGMDLSKTFITTRSYELLMAAVEMVREDSPDVLQAILNENPHAPAVLQRFAAQLSHLGHAQPVSGPAVRSS